MLARLHIFIALPDRNANNNLMKKDPGGRGEIRKTSLVFLKIILTLGNNVRKELSRIN
jgi:hypothetical protein